MTAAVTLWVALAAAAVVMLVVAALAAVAVD